MVDINNIAWTGHCNQLYPTYGNEIINDSMEIDSSCTDNYCTETPMVQVINKNFEMENMGYHSQLITDHQSAMHKTAMDQLNEDEIEQLERCLVYEVNRIRGEFHLPLVELSSVLSESGKLKSQLYCGICLQRDNHLPYRSVAYAIKRLAGLHPGAYARVLAKQWRMSEEMMRELTEPCIRGIGVGVWGTLDAFVATLVRL